jgi:hypothetical protein
MSWTLTIEILEYWHAGTGRGQGAALDATTIRSQSGLPYLPGRTVRGLLRDGATLAESLGRIPAGRTVAMFGDDRVPGCLYFGDAELPGEVERWVRSCGGAESDVAASLFRTIASTAIEPETGTARDRSLRAMEVAVPMTLRSEVRLRVDPVLSPTPVTADDVETALREAARFVRGVGSDRRRGLGRATVSIAARAPSEGSAVAPAATASTLWLEIDLLSDVIQTAAAATEGPHESLDHLRGSTLLGATAAAVYDRLPPDQAFACFIDGGVRFSDAVPVFPGHGPGTPVPASWLVDKRRRPPTGAPLRGEDVWVSLHEFHGDVPELDGLRGGYFTDDGVWWRPDTTYRLKTAIDRERRGAARNAQLFGYEALARGSRWLSSVTFGSRVSPETRALIRSALDGREVLVGRSLGAEYGRVSVRVLAEPPAGRSDPVGARTRVSLALLSDAMLLEPGTGEPTLRPRGEHFGLPGWTLDPAASAVSSRRYSAFHRKRGFHDGERIVISRGSVLTFVAPGGAAPVELESLRASLAHGVGLHRGAGLGSVRVQPWYLESAHPSFAPSPREPAGPASATATATDVPNDLLARWMVAGASHAKAERQVFRQAEEISERLVRDLAAMRAGHTPTPSVTQWKEAAEFAAALTRKGRAREEARRALLEHLTDPQAAARSTPWRQSAPGAREMLAARFVDRCFSARDDGRLPLLCVYHVGRLVARRLQGARRGKEERR